MPEALPDPLTAAARLIKTGEALKARTLLAGYVFEHPTSADAWFLLSYVTPQSNAQIDCLTRVLSLDPDHQEARTRLDRLKIPSRALPPSLPQAASTVKPAIPPGGAGTQAPKPAAAPLTYDLPLPDLAASPLPSIPAFNENPLQPVKSVPHHQTPPFDEGVSSLFESVEKHGGDQDILPSPITPPAGQAAVTAGKKKPKKKSARKPRSRIWVTLLEIMGGLVVIGALMLANQSRPGILFAPTRTPTKTLPVTPSATPSLTPTITQTPIRSATPSPTVTDTPTPRPTSTPTITPTIIPVNAPVAIQMDDIQKQVQNVRGLKDPGTASRTFVSLPDAQDQLSGELLTSDYQKQLATQSLTLSLLGLVPTDTDLSMLALDRQPDPYGGLYLPWRDELVVMGLHFNLQQQFAYAQAYENYLVYHAYDGAALGIGPACSFDLQRCQAIQALYQGEGLFTATQWIKKYTNALVSKDFFSTPQPAEVFNSSPIPYAFVDPDLSFPYQAGYQFVKSVFDRGGWAAINWVFRNPPKSTRQILHPNDYWAKKTPAALTLPDASPALGTGWQLADTNVLGEWNTYLILRYGYLERTRLDDAVAAAAAQGWAGDIYQTYTQASTRQSALIVLWAWDNPKEMAEFHKAMITHLTHLYNEADQQDQPDGSCWVQPGLAACFYSKNNQSLLIVAPDQTAFAALLAQAPNFP